MAATEGQGRVRGSGGADTEHVGMQTKRGTRASHSSLETGACADRVAGRSGAPGSGGRHVRTAAASRARAWMTSSVDSGVLTLATVRSGVMAP